MVARHLFARAIALIWLLADADQHAALRWRVEQLAPRHAGHVFEPHVTLQGEVPLDFAAACRLVDRLAAETPVLHWPVRAVESTEHYFGASGTRDGVSPYAHLSLAYGPTQGDAAALRQTLSREFLAQDLVLDRVALCRASSAVAIPDWRLLHVQPLEAKASATYA